MRYISKNGKRKKIEYFVINYKNFILSKISHYLEIKKKKKIGNCLLERDRIQMCEIFKLRKWLSSFRNRQILRSVVITALDYCILRICVHCIADTAERRTERMTFKIRWSRRTTEERRVKLWQRVTLSHGALKSSWVERKTAIMDLNNDLDQHLLHQFSCLGTTDKDDLVKQLQKLLADSHLNETTAAFFLDMNNW